VNKGTKSDQKIARSIAFISRHLNKPVKVTQLAKMAKLSPSYFWALFKQRTGYAPVDFLIRLRMHQACHLLNRTEMTVKQIAATLGYKDSLYFSRAFKSIHGVAPTNYRAAGANAAPLLPPINPVSVFRGVASGHPARDHKRTAK
jgi:AraC-like DNA-binding protein